MPPPCNFCHNTYMIAAPTPEKNVWAKTEKIALKIRIDIASSDPAEYVKSSKIVNPRPMKPPMTRASVAE